MSVANQYYEGFPEIPRTGPFPDRGVNLDETLRIGWTTGGHTGIPVIAAATGPGSEKVRGLIDNTDLHGIMMKTLELGALKKKPGIMKKILGIGARKK